MNHDHTKATRREPVNDEVDMVLRRLRPRMRKARVAHVRRMAVGLAVVPLVGIGAAAMAGEGAGGVPVDTVAAPAIESPPAPGDLEPEPPGVAGAPSDPGSTSTTPTTDLPATEPFDDLTVDLGELGIASVTSDSGALSLVSLDAGPGWELSSAETVDGVLVLVVTDGDRVKTIRIKAGLRGRIHIDVVELVVPPTTTTTAPPPSTTVRPPSTTAAPATDRWVVDVVGRGSFVVERDGDTLLLGAVLDADGFSHEVVKSGGRRVHVVFTDGSWIWHGKAFFDGDGRVQQEFWDEAKVPEPVYQWVEIPGVGAARFKLWNAQVYVKETSPAAGFAPYVYNEIGATVKVDFEGQGQLWIIDVGILDGRLVWEITDATVPPGA